MIDTSIANLASVCMIFFFSGIVFGVLIIPGISDTAEAIREILHHRKEIISLIRRKSNEVD